MKNALAVLGALLVLLSPAVSLACFGLMAKHEVDLTHEDHGKTAPPRPEVSVYSIHRADGPKFTANGNRIVSCVGGYGSILLRVENAPAQFDPECKVGYYVEFVDGQLPAGCVLPTGTFRLDHLRTAAVFPIRWSDGVTETQEPFNFGIRLIAVDHAGNETRSLPIRIADPGRKAPDIIELDIYELE